jgi:hypothetical protein
VNRFRQSAMNVVSDFPGRRSGPREGGSRTVGLVMT